MPNSTTNRIWSSDASYRSTNTGRGTVWIIGCIRPTLTATYKFQLTTITNTLLYLSSDENPMNKKLIANYTSLTSKEIRLEKDTKYENSSLVDNIEFSSSSFSYYFVCITSRLNGEVQLFIRMTILDSTLPAWTSLSGNEIQQIDIGHNFSDNHLVKLEKYVRFLRHVFIRRESSIRKTFRRTG